MCGSGGAAGAVVVFVCLSVYFIFIQFKSGLVVRISNKSPWHYENLNQKFEMANFHDKMLKLKSLPSIVSQSYMLGKWKKTLPSLSSMFTYWTFFDIWHCLGDAGSIRLYRSKSNKVAMSWKHFQWHIFFGGNSNNGTYLLCNHLQWSCYSIWLSNFDLIRFLYSDTHFYWPRHFVFHILSDFYGYTRTQTIYIDKTKLVG